MAFIDTFLAVFIATLLSQFSIFLIDRYVKHRWTKAADRLENKFKGFGGFKMGNLLSLDIERAENGGFIVKEITSASGFMKKSESKDYIFDTFDKLNAWLRTRLGG